MPADLVDLAGRPRWSGRRGRLEVHYLTATDAATGTGIWLHHEVVAPTGDEAPYAHGWLALFPPDAAPSYERFGPSPARPLRDASTWFAAEAVRMSPTAASGHTEHLSWNLDWTSDARPVWTFPRWAWQRNALPAAQVLPVPTTRITGTVNDTPFDGTGGVAHINGHGNAERWVWLHAELGDGDVLELVAATARRRGLNRLPPLPLVQLRVQGSDWPTDPLAAAPLLRARVGQHEFHVGGIVGTRRIRLHASLPPERCVVVPYVDPDGAPATCTNTARADVVIRTQRLGPRGWRDEREWRLDGTGHAEIGTRP